MSNQQWHDATSTSFLVSQKQLTGKYMQIQSLNPSVMWHTVLKMLALGLTIQLALPPNVILPVTSHTCRARCTASANASFLIPPAPFPIAACPPRGAPDPGGGTALYSDMLTWRQAGESRKTELRPAQEWEEKSRNWRGKESAGDKTAAGKVHSRAFYSV